MSFQTFRYPSSIRRAVFIAAAAILLHSSIFAQDANTAIVVGSVTDPVQAAIAEAKVTLTHLDTGASTVVETNSIGRYRTPPLRAGGYTVTFEATGFKRTVQTGVSLSIGDVREINATLSIGQVSESISIEAEAPLLQTADSTVGTVISGQQIRELPLNGRDYLQLATISSGTIPSRANQGKIVGVSVGGQSGQQISFQLDGMDNNSQQLNLTHSGQKEIIKPSIDAIQEFKVVTNSYSAEYGRSSSGIVSVSIKSGSNEVHGTAYEFFRNEVLDAKNFFATEKSPYKRNQFGAAIGLPVIKNRTFFFGDFELGKVRQSLTFVNTMPTPQQKAGFFTTDIIDPTTKQPFPGRQIPISRFDPISTKILPFYLDPQNSPRTNNYVYASPDNQDPRRWDFRVDQIVSDKQNLFFRFSSSTGEYGVVSYLPPDAQGNYFGGGTSASTEVGAQKIDAQNFVLTYNRIWRPDLVMNIRAGWSYDMWTNYFPSQQVHGIGIPGVDTSNPGFSNIAVTGYTAIGIANVPNQDGSQNRQLAGDLIWNKGPHTLKFGSQTYWVQSHFNGSQSSNGRFDFNGQYTRDPFADFLLGTSSGAGITTYLFVAQRSPLTHFFVQDDWRVTRRLTLNAGLRYELNPPAVSKYDAIANFDMDTDPQNPILVYPEGDSRAGRSTLGVNYRQFAPRFGFAYALDNKTVLRGGYGVFYSYQVPLRPENNPPNSIRVDLAPDPAVPSIFLSQGFPPGTLSVENARNVSLTSIDRTNRHVPMTQQWNFNIQRQLPAGIVVEVGYYGNKLDHAWRTYDANPAPPAPGNVNARRRFTTTTLPGTSDTITLSNISRAQLDGYSRYHAFQAKAEKRYSNGLTLHVSYAWSKAIALGGGVQDINNWAAERGLADQDVRHRFVSSAVYELPLGRGKPVGSNWGSFTNGLFGGWSIAPIVSLSTGFPLNLSVNGNPANTGGLNRPNVVGDWRLENPTVEQWFNTAAFVRNAPFTYGNAGRNILVGPGRYNLDVSLLKSVAINERVRLQFRFESFNATNTPPLDEPNTQVGNQNFGIISSAGTQRNNQVAIKVLF